MYCQLLLLNCNESVFCSCCQKKKELYTREHSGFFRNYLTNSSPAASTAQSPAEPADPSQAGTRRRPRHREPPPPQTSQATPQIPLAHSSPGHRHSLLAAGQSGRAGVRLSRPPGLHGPDTDPALPSTGTAAPHPAPRARKHSTHRNPPGKQTPPSPKWQENGSKSCKF